MNKEEQFRKELNYLEGPNTINKKKCTIMEETNIRYSDNTIDEVCNSWNQGDIKR